MDLIFLIGIATALLAILTALFFLQKHAGSSQDPKQGARPVPGHGQDAVPRRAQIARNQRNRLRNAAGADQDGGNNEEDSEGEGVPISISDEKIGTKKRAKLEAKAAQRAQRDAEVKAREEKKKKDAQEEEERRKVEEKDAENERKHEEAERLAREEKERKELEEYLKMKEAFSVEEEGFDEGDDNEKDTLLAEFIQYIKANKTVVLEDLAIHFKLKTQQVIDRISYLQSDGSLTGVVDDRGKFIYISEDELKAVAKFIKQRGRVSIAELAESSASLINLTPINV